MPGTTSITYQNELLTSTAHLAGKEIIDQNDYHLPFFAKHDAVHGKGKPVDEGGQFFIEPLQFDEHSVTTQLSNGYELINLAVVSVGTPLRDEWGFWVRPVVISEKDRWQNRGSAKIYDKAKERTRTVIAGMRREQHKRIWGSGGTGLTDLNTLNGIDYTDGVLEELAVGAQTNDVHNVDKGNYQSSLGWQNQIYDAAGSFNSNGLLGLTAVSTQAKSLLGSAEREGGAEDMQWYVHPTPFTWLKRAVRGQEQYMPKSGTAFDPGVAEFMYDGIPVAINRDMPIAGASSTADPMSIALIDHRWIRMRYQSGYVYQMGEFASPVNQLISAMPIKLVAQLECRFMGTSGIVFDAQAW